MPNPTPRIAIAGAGIGGLCTALHLDSLGCEVVIYEKRPELPQEGAGIQISPNAFKPLHALGLGSQLVESGVAPEAITVRAGRNGGQLARFELGETIERRHGAPYLTLHRADLSHILKAACDKRGSIDIRFNQAITGVHQLDKRLSVSANGPENETLDGLVAADGVWSQLRSQVAGSVQPVFTGHIAWRGILESGSSAPVFHEKTTGLWLGPEAHLVHYPLRGGTQLNVVAVTRWTGDKPPAGGWLDETNAPNWRGVFDQWDPWLESFLSASKDWGGWPIFSVPSIGSLSQGNMCLLGDAGHAMTPYAAQGGAMAIEDAAVLARCVQKHMGDLPLAFEAYARERKKRLARVLQLAQNNRRIYHMSSPASIARNMIMRWSSANMLQRRMDWIYGWTHSS